MSLRLSFVISLSYVFVDVRVLESPKNVRIEHARSSYSWCVSPVNAVPGFDFKTCQMKRRAPLAFVHALDVVGARHPKLCHAGGNA